MIDINQKTFQDAFDAASDDTRALMRDSRISDCLLKKAASLDKNIDMGNLILPFGYYLLGIIPKERIHSELITYGIQSPEKFVEEVLSCIRDAATQSSPDLASQIIEAEAAIATLPTIRTMNQTEPVYSSTQAAILREGGEIGAGSATPKTHPSEAPTWDSAR